MRLEAFIRQVAVHDSIMAGVSECSLEFVAARQHRFQRWLVRAEQHRGRAAQTSNKLTNQPSTLFDSWYDWPQQYQYSKLMTVPLRGSMARDRGRAVRTAAVKASNKTAAAHYIGENEDIPAKLAAG